MIGVVSGTYLGTTKNVQLTISHGCRPFTRGAWCSAGFWRNSSVAAWAKTGHTRTELFNTTAYNVWYGATYAANPTLDTVLTTSGGTYKGAGVAGTSGVPMNAFNAAGALDDSSCPLDNAGNWKQEPASSREARQLPGFFLSMTREVKSGLLRQPLDLHHESLHAPPGGPGFRHCRRPRRFLAPHSRPRASARRFRP